MVNNVKITAIVAKVASCCLVSSAIIISFGMKPENGGSPLNESISRTDVAATVGFFVHRVVNVPMLVALITLSSRNAGVVIMM